MICPSGWPNRTPAAMRPRPAVEHDLHRHEHEEQVAPHQDAGEAQAEEDRRRAGGCAREDSGSHGAAPLFHSSPEVIRGDQARQEWERGPAPRRRHTGRSARPTKRRADHGGRQRQARAAAQDRRRSPLKSTAVKRPPVGRSPLDPQPLALPAADICGPGEYHEGEDEEHHDRARVDDDFERRDEGRAQ